MIPKVMVILGSGSDIEIAKKTTDMLEKLEISYTLKIASAHRTYNLVRELVQKGTDEGIKVFIGIAGLAAHLPGVIAAYTSKPVIGVPVSVNLDGLDSLYSEVQMPYPSPVATVGINRGENAAILSGQIIALSDPKIAKNISKLREEYQKKIIKSNEEIIQKIGDKYINNDFLSLKDIKIENKPIKEYPEFNYDNEVSIIASNYIDLVIAKKTAVVLDRLQIKYDLQIICPIRQPTKFNNYVLGMKNTKIFIGISSKTAVVTGALTSLTSKPIIGVPCKADLGYDSLLSMINMPPGVPVGTVGINNGRNAGILSGQILSNNDPKIQNNLEKVRNKKINL